MLEGVGFWVWYLAQIDTWGLSDRWDSQGVLQRVVMVSVYYWRGVGFFFMLFVNEFGAEGQLYMVSLWSIWSVVHVRAIK